MTETGMPSARQTLSLPNAAGSGSVEMAIIIVIGAVCFGSAAWAFSSVAPQPYMVSEAYFTNSVSR